MCANRPITLKAGDISFVISSSCTVPVLTPFQSQICGDAITSRSRFCTQYNAVGTLSLLAPRFYADCCYGDSDSKTVH